MKKIFLFLIMYSALFGGEALINSLNEGNLSGVAGSVRQTAPKETESVKEMQKKAGVEEKKIKDITINVAEVNLSEETTIDFEYSPKIQQNLNDQMQIDNEQKATIKFNYKF